MTGIEKSCRERSEKGKEKKRGGEGERRDLGVAAVELQQDGWVWAGEG